MENLVPAVDKTAAGERRPGIGHAEHSGTTNPQPLLVTSGDTHLATEPNAHISNVISAMAYRRTQDHKRFTARTVEGGICIWSIQ